MLPSAGPRSQLWQGSTVPSGAMAMLDRHAPQRGVCAKPSARSVSSSSQPGLVKSSSMSKRAAASCAVRSTPASSSGVRRVARLAVLSARPAGISPLQVA